MRGRKYSIIGFLLFMTVMFTGMCFEDVRTDSSFAYVKNREVSSQVLGIGTVIGDEQLCTMRMLRVQGRMVIQQLNNSFVQQRSEAKEFSDILCPDLLAVESGMNFLYAWVCVPDNDNLEERITIFEHKADGKKRLG